VRFRDAPTRACGCDACNALMWTQNFTEPLQDLVLDEESDRSLEGLKLCSHHITKLAFAAFEALDAPTRDIEQRLLLRALSKMGASQHVRSPHEFCEALADQLMALAKETK